MSTKLCLIRHAHTRDNGGSPDPTLSGTTDVPLSALGQREVALLTARLVSEGRAFDAICSSPLSRALDTAAALARAGLGPLSVDDGLREIHCGELEGMSVSRVQQRFPELWAKNLRQDDDDFGWPGGETYRAFRERVWMTIAAIATRFLGAHVAVVTHAGVISQLLGATAGLRAAQWGALRPGNTALTEVEWSGGSLRVLSFDDRSHLSPTHDRATG